MIGVRLDATGRRMAFTQCCQVLTLHRSNSELEEKALMPTLSNIEDARFKLDGTGRILCGVCGLD
jgi:hypothetical protein